MHRMLQQWYRRYLSHPEAVVLIILIGLSAIVTFGFGDMLAPVFAGVVLAYLLEYAVILLQKNKVRRRLAVIIVFSSFLAFLVISLLVILPILGQQLAGLIEEFPNMLRRMEALLYLLPEKFPAIVSNVEIDKLISSAVIEVRSWGKVILSASLASIPVLFGVIVYLVLVPFLIFFFLKDKSLLINWVLRFLPSQRQVVANFWQEVDQQLGNYIRGKVIEMLIIVVATYWLLVFFDLQYAALLAALVGVSVFIPIIGAIVVTLPVVLVAFFQFGLDTNFFYLLIGYIILQVVDGYLVVPMLFAEAINLHPVAIIIAIIMFGGLWGFWGLFFAIPLAALVKALINCWPKVEVIPN